MTAVTAKIIDLFNSLPQEEQDEVRLMINKDRELRSELNYELERSKKSPILSDSDARAAWERLGVQAT